MAKTLQKAKARTLHYLKAKLLIDTLVDTLLKHENKHLPTHQATWRLRHFLRRWLKRYERPRPRDGGHYTVGGTLGDVEAQPDT